MKFLPEKAVWALLRISMGWIFLWAFLDKLFGFGFATAPEAAWLAGGSPTTGFLLHATKGPLAGVFQSLAENALVDWVFMIGLAAIGLSLLLGIFMRIAAYSGVLMLLLMFLAGFLPPEHNPALDEHIVYAIILIGLTAVDSGSWFGFGAWWGKLRIIKTNPYLK